MAGGLEQLDAVPGFTVPVHRALTELEELLNQRLQAA